MLVKQMKKLCILVYTAFEIASCVYHGRCVALVSCPDGFGSKISQNSGTSGYFFPSNLSFVWGKYFWTIQHHQRKTKLIQPSKIFENKTGVISLKWFPHSKNTVRCYHDLTEQLPWGNPACTDVQVSDRVSAAPPAFFQRRTHLPCGACHESWWTDISDWWF